MFRPGQYRNIRWTYGFSNMLFTGFGCLAIGALVTFLIMLPLIDKPSYPPCLTGPELAEQQGWKGNSFQPSVVVFTDGARVDLPPGAKLPKGWSYRDNSETGKTPEMGGDFNIFPPSGACLGTQGKFRELVKIDPTPKSK